MFDFITQNFNWTSFFLGVAIVVLVSSLLNLVKAYIYKAKADKEVKLAESGLNEVMGKMKAKQKELDDLLKKGGLK